MTSATHMTPGQGGELDRVERVLRADARRNREAVIAAAKKLFADQGLDAQMPDVARDANVGVGTVYRHFPTKDDLIGALVAERFERLAQKAREALQADDAWEGIPMIACGLGRITQATVGPASGRWPRLVEINLDGLRSPGSGRLPRCP